MTQGFDIYRYLDYRKLLGDYYRLKKAEGRGFSYRVFSRRAGLRSPNHLKRVIDGQRNLSETSVWQYARVLGLQSERAEYFAALVRFNQACSKDDKRSAYVRLRGFRGYRAAHLIDDRFADYYAHWFVPAIRELVADPRFVADPAWIAPRLRPAISKSEARKALKILVDLGMIRIDATGRATQSEPVVSTGVQTRSLQIAEYHRQMLDAAKRAIDEVPADERYVGALTFCVNEDAYERVRQRVLQFRQELIATLAEESSGDRVVQLGVQLFPLTEPTKP